MASNIPLGTFLEDGVRTGPLYSGQVPSTALPFNPTLDLSYSSYSAYGPATLLSAQNTWNITPAPTSNANVVATTNAVADPNNLTLFGDNVATKLISASNSPTYCQFDWPRVPTVTISGTANLGSAVRVTIFGYDWYGNPMQHTYVVQGRRTYPTISGGALSEPAKAFYSISKISLSSNAFPGGGNTYISVGAADVFGLPFRVNNAGDITSIGWEDSSDLMNNSSQLSAPNTGTATLAIGGPGGTVNVIDTAVTNNSNIQVTRNTPAGVIGNLSVPTRTLNGGFVINSDAAETSTVDWVVINPLGLYTASGQSSNAMVAGVVTINTSQVQLNSNIQLNVDTFSAGAGTHGAWYVSAISPGVSFTVTSTNNTETSRVKWAIMPANWAQGQSNNIGSGINPVAGQVFVNAPSVQANSIILLTYSEPPDNFGILSAPISTAIPPAPPNNIIPGVGFTIVSSNVADTAQVNWAITSLIPGLTQGTATLVGGTITVPSTAVAASSVILLSDNTFGGTVSTYVRVSNRSAGINFTILAAGNLDTSSINWAILPAQFFLPNYIAPLGTFVPADQTFPVTSTTGDVRGLYAPSSPSNGLNVLRFTSYVQGADQWINQTANNQFQEKSLDQPTVGTAIKPLTPKDLYGHPQFYTGSNS